MAKSRGHGSEWYRSRAKTLKGWGLLDLDLRRSKTGAFNAREKSTITRAWKRVEPITANFKDWEKSIATVRVKKGTDTGNRLRVKNTVFVARDGAKSVRVTGKGKNARIVWTIPQQGSVKRVRAPLNPQPGNIERDLARLKKNQTAMIRSAAGKGITPGASSYDAKTFQTYKQMRIAAITEAYRKPGKNRDGTPRKKMNKRDAQKLARAIVNEWYVSEVEYDDE